MTNKTVQQLKQHLNKWVVLSEPDEKIVGTGTDVIEAKADAEHNGYHGEMTFFKVFPFDQYMPYQNAIPLSEGSRH
jgi:hypothetical protein